MPIKWTRQADGKFERTGDLQIGTRTGKVYIDGVKTVGGARNAKMLVQLVQENIDRGISVPAQIYEVREVDVDSPEVIARRTAILLKNQKRQAKEAEAECDI